MPSASSSLDALKAVIARHWGFSSLRPLQEQAMRAVLDGRDSLVVLPTGGGKSLCYQAPAVLSGRRHRRRLAAHRPHERSGGRPPRQRRRRRPDRQLPVRQRTLRRRNGPPQGRDSSPVRLAGTAGVVGLLPPVCSKSASTPSPSTRPIASATGATTSAPNIASWPASASSSPAPPSTATPPPPPNRSAATSSPSSPCAIPSPSSAISIVRISPIASCRGTTWPSRSAKCSTATTARPASSTACAAATWTSWPRRSQKRGVKAVAYHAGLTAEQRHEAAGGVQPRALRRGRGHGRLRHGHRPLQRPLRAAHGHAQVAGALPAGDRPGRPRRPGGRVRAAALRGGRRVASKSMLEKSAQEAEAEPEFLASALRHLDDMDRYARGAVCRHRALVEYFGQTYAAESCGACDLCLGDTEEVAGATVVAQKILSCVARVKESFGINHVVAVLRGDDTRERPPPRPRPADDVRPAQRATARPTCATGSTS